MSDKNDNPKCPFCGRKKTVKQVEEDLYLCTRCRQKMFKGPIIDKKRKEYYSLKELLKGVTPQNRHPKVDFGPPVGKELMW